MDTTTLALFKKLEQRIRDVSLRQGGPRGPKGRKGDTGNKGSIGPKGANGLKGTQGPKGTTGLSGKDGPVGRPGVKGERGPQGATGPQGAAGADGYNGLDGIDGVSVTDAQIDIDGHLTLYMSDGTEIDAGDLFISSEGDITYVAGGGIPDEWKIKLDKVIQDLADHLADFGNPHQVAHDQLIDSATSGEAWVDKHHPQFHDLESHTDVSIVGLVEGHGLWWNGTDWVNRSAFNETWPTGLANGGELNIGPGADDIEVLGGTGVVIDSYTSPNTPPVVQALTWDQINTPITAAPSVAGSIVWFTIFDTGVAGLPINNVPFNVGDVRQYAQTPTPTLARQEIPLGFAVHDGLTWQEVSNPKVINQTAETLREYITSVQALSTIIQGGATTEEGTFGIKQAEGTIWENNRNWHVDKSDPNRETLPASNPITFQYVNRDFTVVGAPTTVVDPEDWDNAGVVEPIPGGVNTATIQRLYLDPANNYWMLYGQNLYPNFLTAQASIAADNANTVVPFLLQNSILLGYAVMENGKASWDVDEAVWLPADTGGAGGGGGGTPITDHNNLNNIGPDDHHNQVHLLYGADHSDVNIAAPLTPNDGLYWDGAAWFTGRRTRAVGDYVQGTTYNNGDELYNGSDLSEALVDGVTSAPFVAPQGTPEFLYTGVGMANVAQLAKQIIFGNRYLNDTQAFYITGYRVNVVAGNQYSVYSVRDPLGTPIATLHSSFIASSTGWVDIATPTSAVGVGVLFDVVVIAQAPDPTPVEVIASYNYLTPQNPTVPAAGEIQHSRGDPAEMRISYTDQGAVDRTALIQSLTIGDTITDGVLSWSVQANTDQGTWAAIIVAPANTSSADIKDFTFATFAPTPTSVPSDPAYWPTSTTPQVEGLIGVDVPYDQVLTDTNAYGVDILIQPAYIPDPAEWRLKVIASTGGSGGGGDFTPTVFAGAGTSGYVPDPVTEDGKYLLDTGTWSNTIDGGTF